MKLRRSASSFSHSGPDAYMYSYFGTGSWLISFIKYPANYSFKKEINLLCTWKVSETTGGCMKVWAAICGGKVGNVGNGLGGCAGCCEVAV